MKKICKSCGKEFETTGRVYCSSECYEQALVSRHTFVCKGCGKSFYSRWRSAAYCSEQCRKRQSRLRHIHRCPSCMKIFFGPAGQKYCSTDCQHKSRQTAERDHVCVNCGKEFSRPERNRDSCQFCSRECAFEYQGRDARHKRRSKRIRQCKECKKIFLIVGHNLAYCSDDCRQAAKERQIRAATKRRFVVESKACKNCGTLFETAYKGDKSFCSKECRERYLKEYKHIHTHHRLDGIVIDRDITLAKLNERDNGICQLCMQPVDWNDYKIDKAGSWITGARYPSIDHIYPICMGGKHEWSNVQLAHFRCNSLKGAGAG